MSDVTRLLDAASTGDPPAAAELLALVYDELRQLASARLAHEKPGQTLQPTALVHEAYLRLLGGDRPDGWSGRSQFFAAAAEAMRRILVESARRKKRLKRGGDLNRLDPDEVDSPAPELHEDVLARDEALDKLAATEPRAAELVRLRYFAGLPLTEVGRAMGISSRTTDRLWAYARAWLHRELRGDR
ncbi:MAG: RNA polymerase subunit sigma [Planctomycetaceae bacterium]|nr:RNA polymerase subunit sigma [Planctomycetaceae bacterium]